MKRIGIDISVLSDPNRTGIGNYIYGLTKSLLKISKYEQFVLFGICPLKTHKDLTNLHFHRRKNVQKSILKIPARLSRRSFILWQQLNWPPIDFFTGQIDIFHSFNWYLPPHKKGKIISTIFDMTSVKFPSWHHERTVELDRIRFNRTARLANLVVTISESSKKDILRYYPHLKVDIIYPAVSDIFLKTVDSQKNSLVLNKYKLKEGYYLSVATLEPRKNISSLIYAYLKSNLSDPLVLVGGEGWKSEKLMSIAKKYPDKIKLTGYIPEEELPILYKNAKIMLYPSLYEGFGIPVLEAMTCGTPVICSNNSSLPEVGRDSVYYINPKKSVEIIKALLDVSSSKGLRFNMSKKGHSQAKRFSWEKSARKLLDIYSKL